MTDETKQQAGPDPGWYTPEQEAALDGVLAGLMAGGDAPDDEEPEVDEEPAAAPTAEVEETETESAPEPKPDPDLEKAVNRLRLAGVPAKAYEGLSPEETLSWATHIAERESTINRALRERADLERRLSELEATDKGEHGVPTPELDLSDERAKLADQFGDAEAETLIQLATKIAATRAPQEAGELRSQLAASSALVEELLADRLRGELGASDSRFSDPKTFDRVRDRAAFLSGDPRYRDLNGIERAKKIMVDAAMLELGPAPVEAKGEEDSGRTKRPGTPTRPTRAVNGTKPPSSYDELLDAKILAIQRGASADTARKIRLGG